MYAPVTLAVISSAVAGDRRAALAELCAALAPLVGREVRAALPASYGALTTELVHDRVQFAWMPPLLLVLTDERVKLKPLLTAVRRNQVAYSGVLFVDDASPIRSTRELRGKCVAWVDGTSAAGYLYPRLHLAAAGIDPDRLFGREMFVGSHPEVARAVFEGRADVGATYAEIRPDGGVVQHSGFGEAMPDRRARILEQTQPIPNDMIVAHASVPIPEQQTMARAIVELTASPQGRRIVGAAFAAEQFSTNVRGTFGRLWELVELARNHGLLHQL